MVRCSRMVRLLLCRLVLVAMAVSCVNPAATLVPTSPPTISAAPTPTPTPMPALTPTPTPASTPTPSPPMPKKPPSVLERVSLPPGYRIEVIYPAPLACPAGIALTPSGDFLIVENSTNDIKVVTPDGKVSTIASGISATAVAINQQGEVFVGGNPGIWKLSRQGERGKFSSVGVSKMTFGPDGYLYTINWHRGNPEIMKISPEGKATVFFTGLSHPSGIAFSPSGELYVADPGAQRIIKVGIDGKMTTIVDGLWRDPIAIRFDNRGNLYFTSQWAEKRESGLYKVSPVDGSISTIVLDAVRGCFEDIAIDDTGNLFLISITHGMLYRINPQGEVTILIEGWHNPQGMVVGSSGDLYIADSSRYPLASGRILRLDMKGNVTTSTEGLRSPNDLAFDSSESLFVADAYGRISRITPQGEEQPFVVGIPNPRSIVYDPVSGDFFVFSFAPSGNNKIFRINPKGNRSAVPIDFGEEVFDGRVAIDKQGNLFVCVVYAKNQGIGPTFSSLLRITTDGDVKGLAKFTDEVPACMVDLAISPSGDVFLLAHPALSGESSFEIRKVTPAGEVSVFAASLPVDPLGIAINTKGDIFFSCSTGIYRIFRAA